MQWLHINARNGTLQGWSDTKTSQASGGSSTHPVRGDVVRNASAKDVETHSSRLSTSPRSSAVEVAGCGMSARSASQNAERSTGTGRAAGIYGSVMATSRCGEQGLTGIASSFSNIASSWRTTLAASFMRPRRSITRTVTSQTTASRTWSFTWATTAGARPKRIAAPAPASPDLTPTFALLH
jgi:hypothetical protein